MPELLRGITIADTKSKESNALGKDLKLLYKQELSQGKERMAPTSLYSYLMHVIQNL